MAPPAATSADHLFERIYAAVRRIPAGRVATYGGISAIATGTPRAARTVGWALNALPGSEAAPVPWWRVVNSQGRISNTASPTAAVDQRALLEAEGVEFGLDGRTDLDRFGWSEEG